MLRYIDAYLASKIIYTSLMLIHSSKENHAYLRHSVSQFKNLSPKRKKFYNNTKSYYGVMINNLANTDHSCSRISFSDISI